jgi:hypothetical protein
MAATRTQTCRRKTLIQGKKGVGIRRLGRRHDGWEVPSLVLAIAPEAGLQRVHSLHVTPIL